MSTSSTSLSESETSSSSPSLSPSSSSAAASAVEAISGLAAGESGIHALELMRKASKEAMSTALFSSSSSSSSIKGKVDSNGGATSVMAALQNILSAISSAADNAAHVVGFGPLPPPPRRPPPPPPPPPPQPAPAPPSSGFSGEDPRYLLRMYNEALCGIMDKLVFKSTPSGYVFVAEQVCPVAAISKSDDVCPKIVTKMDHLVCFLPGTIRLGLESGAGHESMAIEMETQIRAEEIIKAISEWEKDTGEVLVDISTVAANLEEEIIGQEDRNHGTIEHDEEQQQDPRSHILTNISDDTVSYDGVHVELNLPPRFKTKAGFHFVNEALELMESWLAPPLVGNEEDLNDESLETNTTQIPPSATASSKTSYSTSTAYSSSNLIKQVLNEILTSGNEGKPSVCETKVDIDSSIQDTNTENNSNSSSTSSTDPPFVLDDFCSLLSPKKAARALLYSSWSSAHMSVRVCSNSYWSCARDCYLYSGEGLHSKQ